MAERINEGHGGKDIGANKSKAVTPPRPHFLYVFRERSRSPKQLGSEGLNNHNGFAKNNFNVHLINLCLKKENISSALLKCVSTVNGITVYKQGLFKHTHRY